MKVGFWREDALHQSNWIVGIYRIAAGLTWIQPHSVDHDTSSFMPIVSLS